MNEKQTSSAGKLLGQHRQAMLDGLGDKAGDVLALLDLVLDRVDTERFQQAARELDLVDALDTLIILEQRAGDLVRGQEDGPRGEDLDALKTAFAAATAELLRASRRDEALVSRRVLDSIDEALLVISTDRRLVPVNDRGRRVMQRLGGELCHDVLSGSDEICESCELDAVIGLGREGRCKIATRTGPDLRVRLLPHGRGRAMAVVTEVPRRSACQLIQESHVCMLENTGSGMLLADESGCVIYANSTAEELTGHGTAIGTDVEEIVPDLALEPSDDETIIRLKCDGKVRLLGCRCVAVAVRGGQGTMVTMRDVTQIEQMRADMKRLEQLSEAARMCSTMVHEIRNPLAGIRATAESVTEDAEETGLGYALELITEEVDRLDGLLKEYGVLTRHRPPRRKTAVVGEIVDAARKACAGRLVGRKLAFELDDKERVWVDPDQFQQLVTHLLENAADATPRGGEITVRLKTTAEQMVLEVIDTGSGIAKHNLARVMDAFFTTKANGSGLGLPVCFRVVKDHGGQLEINSEAGRGTTVTATVPIIEPE